MYCSTCCQTVHPLGCQKTMPGRLFLRVEEIEVLGELAVVALLGLLQHVQVGVLVFLARPGGAVDPLEHLVAGVAAPVGAGELHQLEYFELAGGRHMRPAAEIDEPAFTIQADRFAGWNGGNDLGLVLLADRLEETDSVVAIPYLPRYRLVELGELPHPRFDGRRGRPGVNGRL